MLLEVSLGAPTTRNAPLAASDSPNNPTVVFSLGEPVPGLVSRMEENCVVRVEVTEVVLPATSVTEEEVEVVEIVEADVVDKDVMVAMVL
jgi:hypothetical protein